ncbi:MAG: twin-arginine translocase TatA/TatE family subunit [Thermoproteota archaeon]
MNATVRELPTRSRHQAAVTPSTSASRASGAPQDIPMKATTSAHHGHTAVQSLWDVVGKLRNININIVGCHHTRWRGLSLMVTQWFQGMEWIIIFVIVLLIFGPTKLPQLARGLGRAIYEFRRASQGALEDESTSRKREELKGIDEETLRKLAEKLGVEKASEKDKETLITEIIEEAKKKGILDEVKVEKK